MGAIVGKLFEERVVLGVLVLATAHTDIGAPAYLNGRGSEFPHATFSLLRRGRAMPQRRVRR